MQTVLVTGANGQLGNELKKIAPQYPQFRFLFVSREELAIDDFDAVSKYFATHEIDHCINCAAYTAVDKAESEPQKAFLINADAVGNLATVCRENNTRFIHVSTDYVFDGTVNHPYKETDITNPIGVYGSSKLRGEELALQHDPSVIIIRTSWLYSSYGNNFVKAMLRLMKERDSVNVVNDQTGSPTYAADLAAGIIEIIANEKSLEKGGIYHYANSGAATWYEFALAIRQISGSSCSVNPIPTAQYPTAAKRPAYSVLNTSKIRETFNISIPDWKDSLTHCLAIIEKS